MYFFFSPPFQDLWKATVTLLWAFGTSRPDFCQQRTGSIYLRTTCKNNYAFADFHSCFHLIPTLDILIIFCEIKLSAVFKLTLILSVVCTNYRIRFLQVFFLIVLPSSGISPCGSTDWAVMPPTLGAALLCSSRAGSDIWLLSRNSIVHWNWGRTVGGA